MFKRALIITALLLAGISTFVLFHQKKETALEMPDLTPRAGEAIPSPEFVKAQSEVVKYRNEIREHPQVVKNYVVLSQVYMQEARVTARHHQYIPIAEKLLHAALTIEPDNFEASVTLATIDMTKHQFADAEQLIEKAIAKNPYNSGAYGVLCDANVELGNYTAAVSACDKMMSVRPDLRSYARASYLREINGDKAGAIGAMKMAADAGAFGTENREWTLYNFANLFLNEGKLDTAAFIYNGILEERPNYAYALSGLAQVNAAKKSYGEAIALLVKASQIAPEHLFIEQLSDVYLAMGDVQAAHTIENKVLDAFNQHELGGWNVDREYALYCANHNIHLREALERAKRELDRRPDNIDAEQTYAWALYKNNRAQEAAPYIERAMRLHTANPLLHYYAGVIYNAAGNNVQAARELNLSLQGNPYLNVLAAQDAHRILASIGSLASIN